MVLVVELLDFKLHVDDPVGAVAVHCANGIWGTLADGLFNTSSGLLYGGGLYHLGVQCMGVAAITAYASVSMFLVFKFIDKTIGLRVSAEDEIIGHWTSQSTPWPPPNADIPPRSPSALGGEGAAGR